MSQYGETLAINQVDICTFLDHQPDYGQIPKSCRELVVPFTLRYDSMQGVTNELNLQPAKIHHPKLDFLHHRTWTPDGVNGLVTKTLF